MAEQVINKKEQEKILNMFSKRVKALGLKRGNKSYYREQAAFMAGVWTALGLQGKFIPPYWQLCCMTNREIIEKNNKKDE